MKNATLEEPDKGVRRKDLTRQDLVYRSSAI